METIYLILIFILFLLAISDLMVGVSNDAVNFLNSAVGSKAAPLKIVMLVAAAGVLVGTLFSGGMMEIARSGIFYPEKFTFANIMLIFLAVMITDVILLDTFNTIGFPTSTTVSLVFELMGASVAIAIFTITAGEGTGNLGDYINSAKALAVILGILLSVIIAFTIGAFAQFVARLIFSFNYERSLKLLGGLFGGFAITMIVYFILIKGAKDAAFMTPEKYGWVKENTLKILTFTFLGFTGLLYLVNILFQINILKIIVLTGTFALAMAFAGNDLVNFIGVPLAGYDSFMAYANTPGANPDTLTMESLKGAVKTPFLFLLLAGLVMVITLYKSKKARTVIMTSVNLSRQDEGEERFGSSVLSRSIVRTGLRVNNSISGILPERLKEWISVRLEPIPRKKKDKNLPAFDLIRASVNLVVASALIALGTSFKLPLSTTYVTFMVAMGTSLSDGAWDRESAVFRITGVFSVISGWFFTAISAFTVSFILATSFFFGGIVVVFVLISVAIYMAYRTHRLHTKYEETVKATKEEEEAVNQGNLNEFCIRIAQSVFVGVSDFYKQIINATGDNALSELKLIRKNIESMQKRARMHRKIVAQLLKGTPEQDADQAWYLIRMQDNLLEIINCIGIIAGATYNHIANYHKPLNQQQLYELMEVSENLTLLLSSMANELSLVDDTFQAKTEILKNSAEAVIEACNRNEVKRIREEMTGNRSSILFMSILQETRNIVHFSSQVMKRMGR